MAKKCDRCGATIYGYNKKYCIDCKRLMDYEKRMKHTDLTLVQGQGKD
jgi:ribosomal protein L37E